MSVKSSQKDPLRGYTLEFGSRMAVVRLRGILAVHGGPPTALS